jgi:hypothetical protein
VTDTVRVFVNAEMMDFPAGSTVADAVRAIDQSIPEKIPRGGAFVTDGRGIDLQPSEALVNGQIIRCGVRARMRSGDADA